MTTQYANAVYEEIIDLHTEADTVSVIGIHTPTNDRPRRMLSGFWKQFKKVKYNGCSVAMVPAARLPADPLQVSYEAGEATIDPRDMLNPIMFKGCHGNDMGMILNQFYSQSRALNDASTSKYGDSVEQRIMRDSGDFVGADYIDELYYKALTDNTWKKTHPQGVFRKSNLHPMVYDVSTNTPFPPSTFGNRTGSSLANDIYGGTGTVRTGNLGPVPSIDGNPSRSIGLEAPLGMIDTEGTYLTVDYDSSGIQFMTNKLKPLGWQDTYTRIGVVKKNSGELNGDADHDAYTIAQWIVDESSVATSFPLTYMGMLLLPPAYKTEQYYRLSIKHSISFAGFRGVSEITDDDIDVLEVAPVENWN